MEWDWQWHAVPGLLAGAAGVTLAIFVLAARPDRAQNRRLAYALLAESAFIFITLGWFVFHYDPQVSLYLGLVSVFAAWALGPLYLLFVGTFPTPLARPFRGPVFGAMVGGFIALFWFLVFLNPGLVYTGVYPVRSFIMSTANPGPLAVLVLLTALPVAIYGLICALHVLRQVRRGLVEGDPKQAKMLAISFGLRDFGFIAIPALLFVVAVFEIQTGQAMGEVAFAIAWFGVSLVMLVYIPMVAYSILRTQLFDIDLRFQTGISRGFVVAIIIAVVVIALELAENLIADEAGTPVAIGAAVAMALLARPLKQVGDRIAIKVLPNVSREPAYIERRKLEVFENTVRGFASDGVFDDKEKLLISTMQEQFGLTDDQVKDVVKKYSLTPMGPPGF